LVATPQAFHFLAPEFFQWIQTTGNAEMNWQRPTAAGEAGAHPIRIAATGFS